MTLDTFIRKSKIFNLHPIYKIGMFIFILVVMQLNASLLYGVLMYLGLNALSISLNAIKIRFHLKLMVASVAAIIFSVFPILILTITTQKPDNPAIEITQGYFLNWSQIYWGIALVLKAACMFAALLFFILSTPMTQILFLMKRMRLPEPFLELVSLIYRNIFMMLSLAREIWLSQQSRLGYNNLKNSIKSFSNLLVSVLLISIGKGEDQHNSLMARCYDGKWNTLPMRFEAHVSFKLSFALFGIVSVVIFWISNVYNWL